MRFEPVSRTFVGTLRVDDDVSKVFPLFSPLGEKSWVPNWNPELLYPPDTEWDQGLIFTTEGAVWVVAALDRATHTVSYYRVEPDRLVANVRVSCRPERSNRTEVEVSYTFVGLTVAGNEIIRAMSDAESTQKMANWEKWIRQAQSVRR
jgi:hypothetical protein